MKKHFLSCLTFLLGFSSCSGPHTYATRYYQINHAPATSPLRTYYVTNYRSCPEGIEFRDLVTGERVMLKDSFFIHEKNTLHDD